MKKPFPVDRSKLESAITTAESNGGLPNITLLCQVVAELYNANNPPRVITHSVVGLRIREWGISIKTIKGKRGRVSDSPTNSDCKPKGNRLSESVLQTLHRDVPLRFHPVIGRLNEGSRSAAVKLKCLECSGWQTSEVAKCVCPDCPLFSFRPYKRIAPN